MKLLSMNNSVCDRFYGEMMLIVSFIFEFFSFKLIDAGGVQLYLTEHHFLSLFIMRSS